MLKMMLKLVVLCAVVSATIAHDLMQGLHVPQPHSFGYAIKDGYGEQFREESGLGGYAVKGSYGFSDGRGIHRRVNYVADHEGFRAQIVTNEPGTANQDPASVKIISSAHPRAHDINSGHAYGVRNGQAGPGITDFGRKGIYNGYNVGPTAYWLTGDGVHGSQLGHASGFGNGQPRASFGDPVQEGRIRGYARNDAGLEYPGHRASIGGTYGTSLGYERQSNSQEQPPFSYRRYAKIYGLWN